MSLQERRTRLPKGIRKKRRKLLSEDKKEEADKLYKEEIFKKDWSIRIEKHLKGEGYQGLDDLGDEANEAIDVWVTIRTRYRSGHYSKGEFDSLREEFTKQYNGVFENESVVSALGFITNKTPRS